MHKLHISVEDYWEEEMLIHSVVRTRMTDKGAQVM